MPDTMTQFACGNIISQNILFINPSKMSMDDNIMTLSLVENTLAGKMTINKNHMKNLEEYIMNNKINKDIIKYIENGSELIRNGTCIFTRTLYANIFGSKIESCLMNINNIVKLIIDIGLHSQDVPYIFTQESAIKFMQEVTYIPDNAIENEILKIMTYPTKACLNTYGYHLVKIFHKKMNKDIHKTLKILYNFMCPAHVLMNMKEH